MATNADKAPRRAKAGREHRLARTASAESVWLAGLGALKEADERGAPFFQRLVRRGREAVRARETTAPRVVGASELQEGLRTRIADQATARIWEEAVLKPGQIALALGAKEGNREKAAHLRKRGSLLGIPRGRGYLYPAFQIDVARREIYPEVREVNETLGAAADPWGVASWWLSTNDRLRARPADLVGSRRAADLVQAAKAVTEPIG